MLTSSVQESSACRKTSLGAAGGLRKALQPKLAVPTYLLNFDLGKAENPRYQISDFSWGVLLFGF